MNNSKQGSSLPSSTRLSPSAKPFELNRSNRQSNSNFAVKSGQQTSVYSQDYCSADPFASLLDSFPKFSLSSGKNGPVFSATMGDFGFGHDDAVTSAFPVESAAHTLEGFNSPHPLMDFQGSSDFDVVSGSGFDLFSTNGSGYGTINVNEQSYEKQGIDFHESLPGKGNNGGSSSTGGGMLKKGSFAADNDKNCPSHSMSGTRGSFVDADGKGIDHGNSSINEWQEKKPGKSVSNDGADHSLTANCRLGVHSTNIPNEVIVESHATIPGLSIETSSKTLGDSDSDVDSPCWKGTMASVLSPTEISGSVHSQCIEKEFQKSNSLNPLAPQFFPSNAEKCKCLGNESVKDDFVSSKPSLTSAVNLLSGAVKGDENLPELNRVSELQHNVNIYEGDKEFNLHNDKTIGSMLNSPSVTESCNIENSSTLKARPVNTVTIEGFVMGTEHVRTSQSRSESFPAKGCPSTPSSSSSQIGVVTGLSKKLEGVSKSLIESPKLDVEVMINAMHVLSELIVQTCAPGQYSYNEHDRDTIQKIIHNLNVVSTDYCGLGVHTLESTHTGNSYYLDKSSELAKGFGETSVETLAVPHTLNQNYNKGQSSVARVVADEGLFPFSLSNDVNTEEGNEIVQRQIIRRSLGNRLQLEKQTQPDSLLFFNLWINSEAERCFEKFKTQRQLMESGMDLNCRNIWT